MKLRLLRSLVRAVPSELAAPTGVDLRYARRPELLTGGNRLTLLRRGAEAYPAMLEAISGARRYVHLETYILRSDRTGERFKEVLIERARSGVKVRLLFDAVGSFNLVSDGFLAVLANAGVEIVEYRPITPWRRKLLARLRKLRASTGLQRYAPPRSHPLREPGHWGLNRRDHQKIIVVDDRVAFTGGINIGDEYATGADGGNWHDLHAKIEGPGALGLAAAFHRAWIDAGGEPYAPPPRPAERERALTPALAHTCDNFGLRNRSRMHGAYRHAIRRARASISIFNAYFIPDQLLRWTLADAVRRGVSVRVIVPARPDVRLVGLASRYLYARLLRAGVRIFEYPERMMHAKAGVIDGVWATIGSFNLDRRSMLHNLEAGLVILDPDFARTLEAQFEHDLASCREVTLDAWRRRPWSERVLEWIAHLFSYWL
jgi:cardiolipin synthase